MLFKPKDGMKVMVFGSVSVFERDGIYQIYVKAMQEDGMGDLYTKYEELKSNLEKEGLFDINHKKKIPFMPKVIGVLTSQTGSVIRDIINVSTRRNPNVYIRLLPVPVQGPGAAEKIAYGIRTMNEEKLADVLILARGGGSLEDLWPFNEEIVAREIYDSEIPIISAVGHETDFTISDFVADLRAPTPSAAAELAVPDIYEIQNKLNTYNNRLRISLKKKTELMRLRYEKCMASRVFKDPTRNIDDNYLKIDGYIKRLANSIQIKQKDLTSKYVEIVTKLDTLSPLKTLTRGYCLTEFNGNIIKSSKNLSIGNEIDIKFYDGTKKAKVIE
jgi:exodeoxyribonuclease VII large subunit